MGLRSSPARPYVRPDHSAGARFPYWQEPPPRSFTQMGLRSSPPRAYVRPDHSAGERFPYRQGPPPMHQTALPFSIGVRATTRGP